MAKKSKVFSRDEILASSGKRIYKYVEVPEWGDGYVRIQSLMGKERDAFEKSVQNDPRAKSAKKDADENLRAKLAAKCIVDEDGNLLFTNSYEVKQLGELPVAGLQRVFNACMALNGISNEDVSDLAEDFLPDDEPDEPSTSD